MRGRSRSWASPRRTSDEQRSTAHEERAYSAIDPIDEQSARPRAAALIYPVVTMREPWTHALSRDLLLGDRPRKRHRSTLRGLHVGPTTPPLFLVHARRHRRAGREQRPTAGPDAQGETPRRSALAAGRAGALRRGPADAPRRRSGSSFWMQAGSKSMNPRSTSVSTRRTRTFRPTRASRAPRSILPQAGGTRAPRYCPWRRR